MRSATGCGIGAVNGAAFALCALLAACGGGGGGGGNDTPGGGVQISPGSATVPVGGRLQLTGPSGSTTWSVDNISGGSTVVGTINGTGLYLAPAKVPSANTVADPQDSVTVTVTADGADNVSTVTLVTRFQSSLTFKTCLVEDCSGELPNALVLADFNSDGASDIVTANTGTGTIALRRTQSSAPGFFADLLAQDILPVGTQGLSEPQALAAVDMDGDAAEDLVVADANLNASGVAVRLRKDSLQVEQRVELPVGSDPLSMATGFLVGDSKRDVVVANFFADSVMVLPGTGAGPLAAPTAILVGFVDRPLGVAVGDVDHNGLDDVVVANSGGTPGSFGLVVGLNNAGSNPFENPETYPVAGSPSAVVLADLNADGYLDALVTDAAGDTLTVFLNRGTSGSGLRFQESLAGPIQTGQEPTSVAAADFNNDGAQDVVVANRQDNSVTTYFGMNDGTLVLAETYLVGSAPQAVAVGDVDADGWFDLAVANSGDGTVSVLRNRGDASSQ